MTQCRIVECLKQKNNGSDVVVFFIVSKKQGSASNIGALPTFIAEKCQLSAIISDINVGPHFCFGAFTMSRSRIIKVSLRIIQYETCKKDTDQ